MNGPMLSLIGGGAALAYITYDWLQYKMRVRNRRDSDEPGLSRYMTYDWKVYFLFAYITFVAYLYGRPIDRVIGPVIEGIEPTMEARRALLVAFYIFFVGLWWSVRQAGKSNVSRRQLIGIQVQEVVHQFRSVFRIRPTVFSALEEANRKIEPPTGTAVAHAVTTFYVTALPRRAFDELKVRIQNPYMDQFIYILERGEDAKHEDILEALDGLLLRLRRARDIRDKAEVNMTVITGQTKVIQIIAVALVTVVGFAGQLRGAYESLPGQLLFLFIATIGVGTSWFIDKKAGALKEKVL